MRQKERVIFLVGPRASGKSTVGALLAHALHLAFTDTDLLVQAEAGCSVATMVAQQGWAHFRAKEAEALRKAAAPGSVVATGGGMVLCPKNRAFMRERGCVLYLHAAPALLAERLAATPQNDLRPSLTGQDMLEEVEDVLKQRLPLYREAAHHELDASLPAVMLADAALHLLSRSPV